MSRDFTQHGAEYGQGCNAKGLGTSVVFQSQTPATFEMENKSKVDFFADQIAKSKSWSPSVKKTTKLTCKKLVNKEIIGKVRSNTCHTDRTATLQENSARSPFDPCRDPGLVIKPSLLVT